MADLAEWMVHIRLSGQYVKQFGCYLQNNGKCLTKTATKRQKLNPQNFTEKVSSVQYDSAVL